MATMWMIVCATILVIVGGAMGEQPACDKVPFTPLPDAVQKGTVCIDGSPDGYYLVPGSGDGAQNWLIYINGGGWCENITTCRDRFDEYNGNSRISFSNITNSNGTLSKSQDFTGILSENEAINPDFYNWNRIYVTYCDQASFLGDTVVDDGQGPIVQFRGSRNFDALVEELLAMGIGAGENVILSGRSAGGLATILHCDGFRARLPNVGRVKCLSDAGFFIRAENVANADYRDQFFASTILLHNISSLLPEKCTKTRDASLCLYPEYLVGDIQTPLFILNSAFDYFQVLSRLVPPNSPDAARWKDCFKYNISCKPADKQLVNDFGGAFFKAINNLPYNPSRGMFIDACFTHSQAYIERFWSPNSIVKLENLTLLEAFGDWYFDRKSVTLITSSAYLDACTT
ncbi:pectin acetylesterase 8-like [Salvia miltiorrhiza]|uniref:pectin acetylesterase 8-like n=1 Tax=Salvia miltiorrhiza TaxID=226208 RepID=UPI0025AC768E|nr:pectin acetylesterase 8-like [Salvia miltiorrhiza]